MTDIQNAPYGSWRSPITAELIVSETVRLGSPALDGDSIYWLEGRPAESGRSVLVRRGATGQAEDVTPAGFNVRTRAHEYGGGAYVVHQGTVYFCNFSDQRVYRQPAGASPVPVTPEGPWRYADAVTDVARRRLICVREEHGMKGGPQNTLVALSQDANGDDPGQILVQGDDFYSSPQLSADGQRLSWLSWNHPQMPWDGTQLWVASVRDDGSLAPATRVAGGEQESIFEPRWSQDGRLYFVSDRSGWWNLYRWRQGETEALCPMEAEFGLPQWVFGMSTYAVAENGTLACAYSQRGRWHLARLNPESGELTSLDVPYTSIQDVVCGPAGIVFLGGSPARTNAVVHLDRQTGASRILKESSAIELDTSYLSVPQPIRFISADGQTAHALFYPPKNHEFRGLPGELPPLLVRSHGGPTAAASTSLDLTLQYWTSRGFAFVDVNYGGSTGYGRTYRERLVGNWGVVDVADCVEAARYLAGRGHVDPERMAIRGSSAGGYTALAALTFRDTFKAGASLYGISQLESLATDTHKFESQYLDRLVGPYPEAREAYLARSPIHFTEGLSAPVIFFQGLEDKIVPPDQAEKMVAALRAKSLPVAYVPFEGEQHGFRQAPNIRRALEAELYFYGRIFGFRPADDVPAIPIDNLEGGG